MAAGQGGSGDVIAGASGADSARGAGLCDSESHLHLDVSPSKRRPQRLHPDVHMILNVSMSRPLPDHLHLT